MGFGADLKDQLNDINQYTLNGISFLQDLRDFIKERVLIEQQYSQAMDKLAKSYIKKFKKSGQNFFGSGTPFPLPNPETEALGSCAQAFLRLLTETENVSRSRNVLAERYANEVSTALKVEIKRKDDARQKHLAFAGFLGKNYETQKAEAEALYNAYKNSGKELDASFKTYEKTIGDRSASEKAAKDWNELNQEKTDKKNDYILSLASLNALKNKYYHADMATLMDQLQLLNEHTIQRGQEIMTEYVTLDSQCLAESQASNDAILQALQACSGEQDSALFVKLVSKPWTEPPDFVFEPQADTDQPTLTTDATDPFILNTLLKALTDLDQCQKDVALQQKEIAGLKNLLEATGKEGKGDVVEVWQNVLESERMLLVKDGPRLKAQTQIDTIRAVLGDIQLAQHQWKGVSSGNCSVCGQSMSLFSKGFACNCCNAKAHTKCQARIPPRCGTEYTPPPFYQPTPSSSTYVTTPVQTAQAPAPAPLKKSPSKPHLAAKAAPQSTSSYVGTAKVMFEFVATNPGELTVKEGDIVYVLEFDDGNGWMRAEIRGKKGVLPANYAQAQFKPSPVPKGGLAERVRALYNFDPQSPDELGIREGDIIEITNKNCAAGWWEGKLNGRVGLFPENYVGPF